MINTFTLCLKWSRRKQAHLVLTQKKKELLSNTEIQTPNISYKLKFTVATISLCTTVPFLTVNKLDDNFTVYDVILQVIPFNQREC